MTAEFCALIGQVAAYLDRHQDGVGRLRAFLDDDKDGLWSTADVKQYTGWSAVHISHLCTSGKLPYIPGNPYKYIPRAVKAALEEMQTGGIYGRRKSRIKTTKR
jgi:hypothetical protein